MRLNTPVTAHERLLDDGGCIVSKTDLHGNIQYVNPYFIEVSGFSEEELIGSPQNIVRHPDMPREAFADMWATLKAGMPWTGLVKNRCKNGDHYWVSANVTPVIEKGQPVGYMSVRTKPSRAQVQEAEMLYRRIREGQARGVVIRRGQATRTGIAGWLKAAGECSLGLQFGLAFSLIALFILALTGLAWSCGAQPVPAAMLGAAALLATFGAWAALSALVVTPLKSATAAARAIAGGDLGSRFDANQRGDMGMLLRTLQQMNVNLFAIIGDVRANVGRIEVATAEIASGNMDLSNRTESQASSLEETASSMEQFAATVRQNADNAVAASHLAATASTIARRGGESVSGVSEVMAEISAASKKIVDIIGIIDGIAFQTNILALNAAVEAARAGEQGRGFAVVAAEVRNLAQRSAGAAKEIKALIEVSAGKVDSGGRLVAETSKTMDDIVASVSRVAGIVGEISQASQEQSSGIGQVNSAITLMDEVTQQNAALVEEAAAAANSLKDQAQELARAVSIFQLEGSATSPARPHAVAHPGTPAQIRLPRRSALLPA